MLLRTLVVPRVLIGCTSAMLVLACGDPGDGDATGGSSTGDASTGAPGTEPGTSSSTAGTTDGGGVDGSGTSEGVDDSSGGPPPPVGTPGCGQALTPGVSTVELQVGADSREYILVIPDGYDPSTPVPLVLGFHGRGSTADISRLYFQIEQSADEPAIFVYPQGLPVASMGGQTGWDLAPTGIDVALFDAIVDEVSNGACVDPSRIFATGHSFGGYMSNALGCFRAQVLRAIAPVAGGPPFGACQDAMVAAWMAHGTLDEVVPFSQGEAARDAMLDRNGCADTSAPTDPAPCEAYDGCSEGMPVVFCAHAETDLQGHMWPRFAGPAIWAFFSGLPSL